MIEGGHHFDGDYAALAQRMLAAIKRGSSHSLARGAESLTDS